MQHSSLIYTEGAKCGRLYLNFTENYHEIVTVFGMSEEYHKHNRGIIIKQERIKVNYLWAIIKALSFSVSQIGSLLPNLGPR